MRKYRIRIFHDIRDHWDSQEKQLREIWDSDIQNRKWISATTCPAHWIGYTKENPGPGKDLRSHVYEIECTREQLLLLTLKTGAIIEVESPDRESGN